MVLEAPMIAKKAQPGQFVIVRAKEESERIPLTIADYDRKEGTVTIIYQIVGAGTMELDTWWDRWGKPARPKGCIKSQW